MRVIREVSMDDRMWDDVWLVFRSGIWQQMTDQVRDNEKNTEDMIFSGHE